MKKILIVGLCAAGVALNVYLSSRVRRNQAIREIDTHISDALVYWNPDSGVSKKEHLMRELDWFRSHHSFAIAIEAHQVEFQTALDKAICKAVKGN